MALARPQPAPRWFYGDWFALEGPRRVPIVAGIGKYGVGALRSAACLVAAGFGDASVQCYADTLADAAEDYEGYAAGKDQQRRERAESA